MFVYELENLSHRSRTEVWTAAELQGNTDL